MRFQRSFGVALALVVSAVMVSTTATSANAVETESKYIVQVPDGQMTQLTKALADIGETADKKFYQGPDAATTTMSASDAQKLAAELPQAQIVKDHPIYLTSTATTDQASAPWHLRALNASATSFIPNTYSYPSSSGSGVDVYLIDTGVDINAYAHPGDELYGRVAPGINLAQDPNPSSSWASSANSSDCWFYKSAWSDDSGTKSFWGGHGTHVAGIIASATYGSAKSATIIPERVFGCPTFIPDSDQSRTNNPLRGTWAASTSADTIYAALDWAIGKQALSGRPSVISMSLGGDLDPLLNNKVQTAISRGITVVSAAGNDSNSPSYPGWYSACNKSPASATGVITVGAINNAMSFASYSNSGPCVSILAPGSSITSVAAWGGSTVMTGTSMATPVVSGVAALYLSANPSATPAQVKSALLSNAQTGLVSGVPAGTTDRLLNANFLLPDVSVTAPSAPSVVSTSVGAVTLRWNTVTATSNGAPANISDAWIRYRVAGTSAWKTFDHPLLGGSTSISVANLSRNTTYEFSVAGVSSAFPGAYSPVVKAKTLSGVASAVRGMWTSRSTRSIKLTWAGPVTTNGGGSVTDYAVYYRRLGTSSWTRFNDGVSSRTYATVSGLRRYTTYQFYVTPVTRYGTGANAFINARTR